MEMRYLKLFNESKKEKENEFYQEVDPVDFFNDNTDRFVDMKRAEELIELLPEGKICEIALFGYPKMDKKYVKFSIDKDINDMPYEISSEISELDDEWFIVFIEHKNIEEEEVWQQCYKCDQWDGLIKCLEDKKIIKIEKV
jgi:hypothetical protein